MVQKAEISFLKSFFLLFGAYLHEYAIDSDAITGVVKWPDEGDSQQFAWHVWDHSLLLSQATLLCDFLFQNKLVDIDRVIVDEGELLAKLESEGWEPAIASAAVNYLFSRDIRMVDDGIETDSFFLHF